MVRIVGLVVAILVLWTTAPLQADAKTDKGKQLFTSQKCTMCHSIAGKGNAKGKLDGVGAKLTAAEIQQWITDPVAMAQKTRAERKPPMQRKQMSSDDVEALVAYLSTLKEK
jgi:mono/diheme cytochrome c family protein